MNLYSFRRAFDVHTSVMSFELCHLIQVTSLPEPPPPEKSSGPSLLTEVYKIVDPDSYRHGLHGTKVLSLLLPSFPLSFSYYLSCTYIVILCIYFPFFD